MRISTFSPWAAALGLAGLLASPGCSDDGVAQLPTTFGPATTSATFWVSQ